MGSTTREIVTLQLGHYSNFVGTHFWNIQDSTFVYNPSEVRYPKQVNHDILFREGQNLLGQVTYTPRLVALDLKGSLNTLKQEGLLYDVEGEDEDLQWAGDVTLHKLDAPQKNQFLKDLNTDENETETETEHSSEKDEKIEETASSQISSNASDEQIFGPKFYDLDNKVNVWSDFLRIHYHPKSVGIVEEFRHGWKNEPFDVFGYGQEIYRNHATRSDIEDRLHFFLEDCDSLQGVQVLVDTYDGFGGLSSSIIEDLVDDCTNKCIKVYSVSPPRFESDTIFKQCHRAVNCLLSYTQLFSHTSAVVPLSLASQLWRLPNPARSFPLLNFNPDLLYHSSSLLAATIDTLSLPYRLDSDSMLMSDLTNSLSTHGRQVLSAYTNFPIPMSKDQNFVDYLQGLGDQSPWQCLTPSCSQNARPECQSVVVRGIAKDKVKSPPGPSQQKSLNNCKNIEDVVQLYMSDVFGTKMNAITSVLQPLPTTTPYPHIFDGSISENGFVDEFQKRPSKLGVKEVPVMTSLQCGPDVRNHLNGLYKWCKKFNIAKFHRFRENGLEEDLFVEALEKLKSVMECYVEKSGGDSETESDDD